MQPTEPSNVEPATDAPVTTETASDLVVQPSRAASFLQRLWRGRDGRFTGRSEDGQLEETTESPPETPRTLTLTQEELDKRIDAETQRREAKRAQQATVERRRKLRDEDPWSYAEEERKAEQAAAMDAQTTSWLGNVGTTHDRFTVDPVVQSLPETEVKRIMALDGAGVGLEGRKLIVTEGLKSLEKIWKAEGAKDAEEKLRRNPAFRKQVLNEFRRGMSEPEFVGSGAPSAADKSVSDILRRQVGSHHSA